MNETHEICIVPAHVLKGLLEIAPKYETRYYLNGVYFDTKAGALVATDGHAMLIVKQTLPTGVIPFIVPRDTIVAALKLATKKTPISVVLNTDGTKLRSVQFNAAKGSAVGQEIDGKFPTYRVVVPKTPSGQKAHYNPELLARVQHGLRLIADAGDDFPIDVVHNGTDAGVAAGKNPDAFAVVMPWRMDKCEGWAAAALAAFKAVQA